MNTAKYSELQDRLSNTESDLKIFIIDTLKRYGGRISFTPPEDDENCNNNYPVTTTLSGRHDFPRIHISSVYLDARDHIYADGIDDEMDEKREGFSVESEHIADIFHFIGATTEQNTLVTQQRLRMGQRVFWNDPDEGHSSGVYTIYRLPDDELEDSELDGSDIIHISDDFSEAEVYRFELETNILKVVFRKKNEDGDIVAIFPRRPWSQEPNVITSYAHVGQHSAACYDWISESTVPATESEYADLLNELKQIGYTAIEIITEYKPQFN